MKKIKLRNGEFTTVDDIDYESLSQHSWLCMNSKYTKYAGRWENVEGKRRYILMHREILGIADQRVFADHRDGNGLNNVRSNLRRCNKAQNCANTRKVAKCWSKFKGVSLHSPSGLWRSIIRINGRQISLGYFHTEEAAARVYDAVALRHRGEFAAINFPEGVANG
jgi:hypothetical protein